MNIETTKQYTITNIINKIFFGEILNSPKCVCFDILEFEDGRITAEEDSGGEYASFIIENVDENIINIGDIVQFKYSNIEKCNRENLLTITGIVINDIEYDCIVASEGGNPSTYGILTD